MPEWETIMKVEFDALINNITLSLVLKPQGGKPILSKWLYMVKLKLDFTLDKYKSRMVAKSYRKKFGMDYSEIFSFVVKIQTIRAVLTLALFLGWSLK